MSAPARLAAAALLAASAASCAKPQAKSGFDVSLPMTEVMGHVVDPGSWAFWHASGEVVTAQGTKSLLPTTEDGWLAAESGATTVAEAGNLLLMPGRQQDDTDWPRYAHAMQQAAYRAKDAAEKHDGPAMFTTGAAMYETCVACHAKYVIPVAIAANREVTDKAHLTDLPDDVKAKISAYEKGHAVKS